MIIISFLILLKISRIKKKKKIENLRMGICFIKNTIKMVFCLFLLFFLKKNKQKLRKI